MRKIFLNLFRCIMYKHTHTHTYTCVRMCTHACVYMCLYWLSPSEWVGSICTVDVNWTKKYVPAVNECKTNEVLQIIHLKSMCTENWNAHFHSSQNEYKQEIELFYAMCSIFDRWNCTLFTVYGMGMNTDKASAVVTQAPMVLFANGCYKELVKFGMPLIATHHNDCLNDTKIFDICHCMRIVCYWFPMWPYFCCKA
jgi:hypothetical protein